jgi:hypothetical protein
MSRADERRWDGRTIGPPVPASNGVRVGDYGAAASIFLEYVGMPFLMTYRP